MANYAGQKIDDSKRPKNYVLKQKKPLLFILISSVAEPEPVGAEVFRLQPEPI